MSIKNLLNKKHLDDFDLDELARYCGYDDFNGFSEYTDDHWNWHIDELCGDDTLPYEDFLLDEAREKYNTEIAAKEELKVQS